MEKCELPKPQPYEYICGHERLAPEESELVAEMDQIPLQEREYRLSRLTISVQARIRPLCSSVLGTWEVEAPCGKLRFDIVVKRGLAQFEQVFPTYTLRSALQYTCLNGMNMFFGPVTIQYEGKTPQPHLDDESPVSLQISSLAIDSIEFSYGSCKETDIQVRKAQRVPKVATRISHTRFPAWDHMSKEYMLSALQCMLIRHPNFALDVGEVLNTHCDTPLVPSEVSPLTLL